MVLALPVRIASGVSNGGFLAACKSLILQPLVSLFPAVSKDVVWHGESQRANDLQAAMLLSVARSAEPESESRPIVQENLFATQVFANCYRDLRGKSLGFGA